MLGSLLQNYMNSCNSEVMGICYEGIVMVVLGYIVMDVNFAKYSEFEIKIHYEGLP